MFSYLKCIVLDKLLKLRQSFRITLYKNDPQYIIKSSVLSGQILRDTPLTFFGRVAVCILAGLETFSCRETGYTNLRYTRV